MSTEKEITDAYLGVVEACGEAVAEAMRSLKRFGVQDLGNGTPKFKLLADQKKQENAVLEESGLLSWSDVLEEETLEAFTETDNELLYKELVQVAAVSLLWCEALKRKR